MRTAFALVALLGACAGHGGSSDAPNVFIAFADTFQSFRTWTSFHDDYEASPSPEVNGPRTQYINQTPPHGSTEFPVGTIIVEARENAAMNIFAAVKRGGDFNATGAVNWEWFELQELDGPGSFVKQLWRGYGPQSPTDSYGGDINTCNNCHKTCGDNDYVCSPKLQLASF